MQLSYGWRINWSLSKPQKWIKFTAGILYLDLYWPYSGDNSFISIKLLRFTSIDSWYPSPYTMPFTSWSPSSGPSYTFVLLGRPTRTELQHKSAEKDDRREIPKQGQTAYIQHSHISRRVIRKWDNCCLGYLSCLLTLKIAMQKVSFIHLSLHFLECWSAGLIDFARIC